MSLGESLVPPDVVATMQRIAAGTPTGGAWVEVGVFEGGTALALYRQAAGRSLHLFDTFTGIPVSEPDRGDTHKVGDFTVNATVLDALRTAMPDACFHVGLFPETLPDDLHDIAFVHVDCDQYRSVSDCITWLMPRMLPGGVMWFDDFYDLVGARRAVNTYFPKERLTMTTGGRCYVVKKTQTDRATMVTVKGPSC